MFNQLRKFILCVAAVGHAAHAADVHLFVSPSGNDSNEGTVASPLATLHEARDRIRQLRESSENLPSSCVVHVLPGTHFLSQPFELKQHDSGTANAPIIYRAQAGHDVSLSAGLRVDEWRPVDSKFAMKFPEKARQFIVSAKLPTRLIDAVGTTTVRSRHQVKSPATWELVIQGRRMQLAGWPNQGWAKIADVQAGGRSWMAKELRSNLTQTATAWAHGFWSTDWDDSYHAVTVTHMQSADGQLQTRVDLTQPFERPLKLGARYRIENLSGELDSPGEWLADPMSGQMFLWPPENVDVRNAVLANLETPISLYDVSHVHLVGFTIESARVCGIEIVGGESVTVADCTLRHIGNIGVNVYHGQRHVIRDCEIHDTGAGAIRVEGGDCQRLTACNHIIERNHLRDFSQVYLAYRPAVNVYGVGVQVRRNLIHDGPHSAIILHGNEHLVEGNEIHTVCRDTDDVGAIYLAHDPTFRGNVIRQNYLHDLGGFSPTGVIGVYLDDFASGTTVSENIFVRTVRGVAVGGGRDNTVTNNLFIDCLAAIQIDNRGHTWARSFFEGAPSKYFEYCSAVLFNQGEYARRYPTLATVFEDQPSMAKGNRIEHNLIDCPIGVDLHDDLGEQVVAVKENLMNARAILVGADQNDFRFNPQSALRTRGFTPLSIQRAGRTKDVSLYIQAKPSLDAQ